jgi:ribosomal protein L37E
MTIWSQFCLYLVKDSTMSDLVHGAQQEFWRPPVVQDATSSLAEACRRCGTEFMVGAAFCHICGSGRHRSIATPANSWLPPFGAFRHLEFAAIKRWLGLPFASLCAFLVGAAFLVVALSVGLLNSDFEAIQLWRIQWLMAACAAFLAGILLKTRKTQN